MMKMIGYLVCILMMASPILAQVGKLGRCPEVKAVPNFNPEKFTGPWYVISHNKNALYEPGHKCSRWNYIKTGDGIGKLKFNALLANSGAKVDWEGKATPIGEAPSANFDIVFPKPSLGMKTNFTILTTDYDHYAVQWACQNYGDASLQYVWILSRTPVRHPLFGNQAERFVERYVDIPKPEIVDVDQQQCPQF
ncbi:apolipoprotein D [Diachasma alloeum]|uniref:apolipoprotein D n=1 Tax=Diachasma alloeum TaxID=454923 RepID=UPI00073849D6|nr:apolipoprotein D [Diachasma alloeum]